MLNHRARAVIDTLIPDDAHPQLKHGALKLGYAQYYEQWRKEAVFAMVFGFRFALFLAIWVAPLLIRKIPPITLYDRETRERIILALYTSKLYLFRQMFLLLKATILFHYAAQPEVRDAVGFPKQADAAREVVS
jgi:hypothetical protein